MVSNNINSDEIIYVGFGVDEANYSDYSNIDVKGKIVIAKAGEPKNEDGTYIVSGTSTTSKWSSARTKRDAAKERGAKAMFLLDIAMFERYSAYYKRQNENGNSIGLSFPTEDGMYAFLINEDLAKAFIPDINTNATPAVIKADLEIKYTGKSKDIDTENVVAYIKGSEKPNEYIVISAHLDHVGITDGNVFNGADDDGSGTVAMLEIAEAFQKAVKNGHTPKRSIVFLHVTGEERGLLGSRYYTDMDPIFPLAQTVANLNIDMVGRTDPKREGSRNYIYLIGADKLSTELHDLSETMNTKYTQMELDYKYNDENDPNRFYYRSDHYNFAKNNVPIIFYFNGTHDDYHKHTDTPDKIQYDLLENRSKLIFYTAWEIANRDKRLVVDKAKEAVGSH